MRTDRSSDQRHTASCRAAPSSRENRRNPWPDIRFAIPPTARAAREEHPSSARARGACVCAMPTSCGSDRRPAFDGLALGAVLKTGSTQVHQLLDRAVSRAGAVARSSWWCDPIFQTCQWREEHACTPFELQLTRAERREASGLGSRDLRLQYESTSLSNGAPRLALSLRAVRRGRRRTASLNRTTASFRAIDSSASSRRGNRATTSPASLRSPQWTTSTRVWPGGAPAKWRRQPRALTALSPRRAPHACIGSRIGWR